MNCFVSQETLWNFQQHWNCKIMGTFKIDMPRWSTRAECYDLNVNVLCHRLRYLNSWSRNGSWLGELWSLQEAEQTESNQSLKDTLRFIFWPWFWCPPPRLHNKQMSPPPWYHLSPYISSPGWNVTPPITSQNKVLWHCYWVFGCN